MTCGQNGFLFSFKMLCMMLIVWIIALVALCVGSMLTLAFYLGSNLAGSKSNALVWMVLGSPILAWALLLHKGVQWIFRPVTEKRPIHLVGVYMGFIISQLAASFWFILSWMGG
jgi:hypothetical protein